MNRLLYLLLFTSATWQLQAQVSAFFKVDSTQACQTLNVIVTNQAISNPTPVDSIVINFGDGHIDTIVSPAYDSQYPHFYSEPGNYTILFTAYKNGVYNTKQQVINVYALQIQLLQQERILIIPCKIHFTLLPIVIFLLQLCIPILYTLGW